jgi:hypothetical protein
MKLLRRACGTQLEYNHPLALVQMDFVRLRCDSKLIATATVAPEVPL